MIVDKYIDEGYSATNLKRPNLKRMIEDVAR
ncbi:recombinase family protein [Clostridioides difficile]